MQALPAFRHSMAASTVTFGRASYTISTTPSGTRSLVRRRPFSSVWERSTAPIGSGSAAMSSTAADSASVRASSRVSRSRIAGRSPLGRRQVEPVGGDQLVAALPDRRRHRRQRPVLVGAAERRQGTRRLARPRGHSR